MLVEVAVEVPNAVDEFGDLAGAAEVGRKLVNCGRGQFGVENIVEPSPFEIGGADGLGFVAGDEDGHGAAAKLEQPERETSDKEAFDRSQILAFIDGDAIPGERGGREFGELGNRGPGEVEVREEARGQGAGRFFEADGGGVGLLGGSPAE